MPMRLGIFIFVLFFDHLRASLAQIKSNLLRLPSIHVDDDAAFAVG